MIPHTMSYALRGNELGWSAGSGTLQFLYSCQLRVVKDARSKPNYQKHY